MTRPPTPIYGLARSRFMVSLMYMGGSKKTVKRNEQDMYIKLYNNEGQGVATAKNQYPHIWRY